jgi:hypothetical protein
MDAVLNLHTKLLAFGDKTINSNPRLRAVDWEREALGIPVKDPESKGHQILAGSSKVIFDGTRSTTIDGTTSFSIGINFANPSLYRITHTGGTNPTFKTGRGLTLTGIALTFAVNPNNLVTLSLPMAAPFDFTNVQPGDVIFIPHTSTGDAANVINILNSGYWQVLAKADNLTLSLTRDPNTFFEGVGETVTLTSNSQIRAFSSTGVQVGDSVAISAGFSISTQKTFTVSAVTDLFIEITSTLPLPSETNIVPGVSGMLFYTENKRIVYIEADQECVVRLNGDSGNTQRISPIEPGNASKPGMYLKSGDVFSMTIVNKSFATLNVLVVSAE